MRTRRQSVVTALLLYAAAFAFTALAQRASSRSLQPSLEWSGERLRQLQELWPRALAPGRKAVAFVGASEIESAVWPTAIDGELARRGITGATLNLGVRGINLAQSSFVRWLIGAALERQVRFELVALKFNVSRSTLRYRHDPLARAHAHHYRTLLGAEAAESWAQRVEDRLRLRTGTLEAAANGAILTARAWLLSKPSAVSLPDEGPSPAQQRFFQFWRDPTLNPYPAWDLERRGEFRWGLPASLPRYASFATLLEDPAHFPEWVRYYDDCCQLSAPELDPEAIAELTADLRALHQVSNRVALLYFPDSPRLRYPAPLLARIRETLARVSAEGNAELWDLSSPALLQESDYLDPGHLNQAGAAKLNAALVEQLARTLPAR